MLNLASRRLSHAVGTAGRRGRHLFKISEDLLDPLRFVEAEIFTVLLAVLEVLLLRYLGPDEIAVAGRDHGSETLSLRIDLADNPTFLDLIARARDAIQMAPIDRGGVPSEALLILSSELVVSKAHGLVFAFTESERGLDGCLEYDADRLEDFQARALASHFENLLKEAVARPGARISNFEMFDASEKHRILVEWNGETRGYPSECAHELFEQQVERTPGSIAAVFEGSHLTYRELNERANQLAHYLQRKGAGPEVPVGILLDSSFETVIAVIAILKAGGAYLALDHRQPVHRLREVVQDSQLSLVVTSSAKGGYRAFASELGELNFVCLDLEASQIAQESSANTCSGVGPHHMAFIRYTSGSTGSPKGVVSVHRALISRLKSLPLPEIAPSDVCMVNTSWGFGTRLFYPLALGATIAIVLEEDARNPLRLADSLERNQVTSIFLVPSHLRQLLSGGADLSSRLRRLRTVTVGGETLTPDLIARFKELLPQAQLFNNYGGAEVGGTASMTAVNGDLSTTTNSIGRPVVNTSVHILDRDLNPVPQGVVGEICVGSENIARGYLHRPDLTESRFAANPFGTGRIYRTGDLGRHLSDGQIEFLGRADRQVKIRGFRIELEEIEAVLHDNGQIHQAVVTAHEGGDAKRLVAYVVPVTGVMLAVSALQKFLRQRLPDYMIPSTFVFLDRIPLNKNGKADLQGLPAPSPQRPGLDSLYEAPRNPLEMAIAEIWSAVLGVEPVGIHDSFIELGGDSLLATGVSARIRKRLEFDVPMELILEWDIARIAEEIAASA